MKRLLLSAALTILSACASQQQVAEEYHDVPKPTENSHRTVLFILVDGLPLKTLTSEIHQGHLPAISDFFVKSEDQIYVARTGFPSLTYPSLSSLLTGSPVDSHGIYGNTIIKNQKKYLLEDPAAYDELNDFIGTREIFAQLNGRGKRTVSLSYSFGADASVHSKSKDLQAGVAILNRNYRYVDEKLIGSLDQLLEKTTPQDWPDFIFLHLVGVDLTSHDQGPQSKAVFDYLHHLDDQLKPVFEKLNTKQRQVVALLSSDHGFDDQVSRVFDFEDFVEHFDREAIFLNEGRFGAVHFSRQMTPERKSYLFDHLTANPFIDIVAYREGDSVVVRSAGKESKIIYLNGQNCGQANFRMSVLPSGPTVAASTNFTEWTCPEDLNLDSNTLYYPFFMSNIAHYFQADAHPDAVIIPKPGVAFHNKNLGQHGGPTPKEVFVPLLMHNASLPDKNRVPAIWDLLKFMQ